MFTGSGTRPQHMIPVPTHAALRTPTVRRPRLLASAASAKVEKYGEAQQAP